MTQLTLIFVLPLLGAAVILLWPGLAPHRLRGIAFGTSFLTISFLEFAVCL